MKLTLYTNACCTYEEDGFLLLTDPWLTPGIYEGMWYIYPPLKVNIPELAKKTDAIYISHLHPDHFDVKTLKYFDKDVLVIILDHGINLLKKILDEFGFTNILMIKEGADPKKVGPFDLWMYAPFAKHVFNESTVGNLIDSALVVKGKDHCILNTNDNLPDTGSAEFLRKKHGKFTVAQIVYGAAGPYPSSFNNYSLEEKKVKHEMVKKQMLDHFAKLTRILEPEYIMPFAGDYVLAGKYRWKNGLTGTPTLDEVSQYLDEELPYQKKIILNEELTFSLTEGKILNGTYKKLDLVGLKDFIDNDLADVKYTYEEDTELNALAPEKLVSNVKGMLHEARLHVYKFQERLNFYTNLHLYIRIEPTGEYFHFNFNDQECEFIQGEDSFIEPYLRCDMDERLLSKILTRDAHWNDVEGTNHIDFVRIPDIHVPDIHTMMSFFHLNKRETVSAN